MIVEMAQETHATLRYLQACKRALPAEIRLNRRTNTLFNKVITATLTELKRIGRVPGDASVVRGITSAFDKYGPKIIEEIAKETIRQAQQGRDRTLQEAGLYTILRDKVPLPDHTYNLIKNRAFEASAQTVTRMRGDVMEVARPILSGRPWYR